MYVTVHNNSGLALNDVSVAIVPVGRSTMYNKFVGRIENAESRNVMLGDFYGRDGTPFSLRVVEAAVRRSEGQRRERTGTTPSRSPGGNRRKSVRRRPRQARGWYDRRP